MTKILVVDDDPDIRKLLTIRLEHEGFETAVAGDAVTALTIASEENPDLIVLDLDLGVAGGDGYVVMERLRALAPFATTPIVVLSAQPTIPYAEKSLAAGATAFVEKPFGVETLLLAVHDVLG